MHLQYSAFLTHLLKYRVLLRRLAVCRLPADASVPAWATADAFFSVTRTSGELSIICGEELVPDGVQAEKGWAAFQLEGPFAFSLTGVLESFLQPLAAAQIPVFAVSSFDTDYVLIKHENLASAEGALRGAGHLRSELSDS